VLLNGVGQGSECARTNFRGSKEQNLAVAALDSVTTRLLGDKDNQQHVLEESMAATGGERGSGQRGFFCELELPFPLHETQAPDTISSLFSR
jgi:hypothetical protein